MVTATAPGKIILFGEHAVVYGQPALAAPVSQLRATATITPVEAGLWIEAHDLNHRYRLDDAPADDPLALAIHLTFRHYQLPITNYPLRLTLSSTVPLASGLGSGAAICTAIVRALSSHLNAQRPLSNSQISAIVFETEKLLHGTPSGIDNTVVAYEQPVYFVKGHPPQPFTVAQPFHLLIADTGLPSPTKIAVGDVRAAWEKEPRRYEQMFDEIGAIVQQAKGLIEQGFASPPHRFGSLMSRNHSVLKEMGVSCLELDTLAQAALEAGAFGAKLSGGGRGGNLLALVTPETQDGVRAALEQAGAKNVFSTIITHNSNPAPGIRYG